jgi:type IX secretion system PorP/SprF family membrane protein
MEIMKPKYQLNYKVAGVLLFFILCLKSFSGYAQQDPQFTNYMYNTMTVNPAYAGQRETLSILALNRSQWVGIDGAPTTQTFSIHSPLKNEQLGLGLNVVNDALGPSNETFIDANFSYTLLLNDNDLKLSFGASAGLHILSTDWSKGIFQNPDVVFNENINLTSPLIGAGAYLHSRKYYIGFSVPNFLQTDHYDDFQESLATERMHFYLIGGYVFDLSPTLQFKPAFLTKAVSGAPLIVDVSANFWINEKVTLGLAYRWDDALSFLAGFQISRHFYFGYAYDWNQTGLSNYTGGSHEFFLRYELNRVGKILSPRFF